MNPGAAPFFHTGGGSLPPDAPSYVVRRADHELLQALRAGDQLAELRVNPVHHQVEQALETRFAQPHDVAKAGHSRGVGNIQWPEERVAGGEFGESASPMIRVVRPRRRPKSTTLAQMIPRPI